MSEKTARFLHALLITVLAGGVGVWLWRVYGFTPLTVRDTGEGKP